MGRSWPGCFFLRGLYVAIPTLLVMQLNDLASILLAFVIYVAVLVFGLACSWIASRRRALRSVGRTPTREPLGRNFYGLFTRHPPR
jgi:hypothetical protein